MQNHEMANLETSIPHSLKTIESEGGYWSDLSFLAGSSKTLKSITLKNNKAESLDLEAIRGFPRLANVEFENMHIKDYAPLYDLPALEWLIIKENVCKANTLDVKQLKVNRLLGLDVYDVAAPLDYLDEIDLCLVNVAVQLPNIDLCAPCSDKVIRQLTSRNRFAQTTEHILCVCSSSIQYSALWVGMNIFNTDELYDPPVRAVPGMCCKYCLPYADTERGIRRSRPFAATMIPINMDGVNGLARLSRKVTEIEISSTLKLFWDDLDHERKGVVVGSGGSRMGILYFFLRTGEKTTYIQQFAKRFDVIEISMLADPEQNRALLDIAHAVSKPAIVTDRSECLADMTEWEDYFALSALTRKEKYEVLFGAPKELLLRVDPMVYIEDTERRLSHDHPGI